MPFFYTQQFFSGIYTGREKAVYANALAEFIQRDFARPFFTQKLYGWLTISFGFSASSPEAFYDLWFSTWDKRVSFVEHLVNYKSVGLAEYTLGDVEKRLQIWLREGNVLENVKILAGRESRYDRVRTLASAATSRVSTEQEIYFAVGHARLAVESEVGVRLEAERLREIAKDLIRQNTQE